MKKEENTIQLTITKSKLHFHKVMLKIGNWKKHFDFNYTNTIIAMALNYCAKNNSFFINGYLITNQNLYLVIQTNEKNIDATVHKIEAQIIHLLKTNRQKLKENRGEISFIADDDNLFYAARKPLFKIHPLENDHLVKLITGKKVTLPYFNRDLENLKTMVHNHPFCSAINYLGGVGSVEVTPFRD